MKLSSTLIGLGGKLRSGKDVVADHLVAEHGFVKVGMSDALHEAMLAIDPWVTHPERPSGSQQLTRYSALIRRLGYVEAKTNPEVRRLLQKLGTEVGRNMIGVNTWANVMARKIDDHRGAGHPVVVTGIRFPNEIQMIEELGGQAVWIERPGAQAPTEGTATHASENSVSEGDFAYVIRNNTTLEALRGMADSLAALAGG